MTARARVAVLTAGAVAVVAILVAGTAAVPTARAALDRRDALIDDPFPFAIRRNIVEDYEAIAPVRSSRVVCPLARENIADPAFCMILELEFDGMSVTAFSFDVIHNGMAEYVVTDPSFPLRSGIRIGSSWKDAIRALGVPSRVDWEEWHWKSRRRGSEIIVALDRRGRVAEVRWHDPDW